MTEIPSSVLILQLLHLFSGERRVFSGARLVQSPFSPTGPCVTSHHNPQTRTHRREHGLLILIKQPNCARRPLFQAETWTREHMHVGVTETWYLPPWSLKLDPRDHVWPHTSTRKETHKHTWLYTDTHTGHAAQTDSWRIWLGQPPTFILARRSVRQR